MECVFSERERQRFLTHRDVVAILGLALAVYLWREVVDFEGGCEREGEKGEEREDREPHLAEVGGSLWYGVLAGVE